LGCAIPLWAVMTLTSSVYHQQQFLIQYQSSEYLNWSQQFAAHFENLDQNAQNFDQNAQNFRNSVQNDSNLSTSTLSETKSDGTIRTNIIYTDSDMESDGLADNYSNDVGKVEKKNFDFKKFQTIPNYSTLVLSNLVDSLTTPSKEYCSLFLPYDSQPKSAFLFTDEEMFYDDFGDFRIDFDKTRYGNLEKINFPKNIQNSKSTTPNTELSCQYSLPLTRYESQGGYLEHKYAQNGNPVEVVGVSVSVLNHQQISAISRHLQSFLNNITRTTWTPFPVHSHTFEFSPHIIAQSFKNDRNDKNDKNDTVNEDPNSRTHPKVIRYDQLWIVATSGIVALGLGDTFATVFGKVFGKTHQIPSVSNSKTFPTEQTKSSARWINFAPVRVTTPAIGIDDQREPLRMTYP